jgi:hypothetical protein
MRVSGLEWGREVSCRRDEGEEVGCYLFRSINCLDYETPFRRLPCVSNADAMHPYMS